MPPFSAEDRLLIVAPHPDDEAIAASGAIQSALAAKAGVKVLYVTHGEHNEIASLFYQKKPLLLKSDFVKSGKIRMQEARGAMAVLGLGADDLVFLGYPDFGMLRIWRRHWGPGAKPFRSVLTRINRVLSKSDLSYGAYYKGENVVADFKKVLESYRPTVILVSAPFDRNPDHQAAALFLDVALHDLAGRVPAPRVYRYLVHARRWPRPKRYAPEAALELPAHLSWTGEFRWTKVGVPPAFVERKKHAVGAYESQLAYTKDFLLSFVRTNELFAPPVLRAFGSAPPVPPEKSSIRYALEGDDVRIELHVTQPLDEMGALGVDLFGWRPDVPFERMPKINLGIYGKRLVVLDGSRRVRTHGVRYEPSRQSVTLRVPRSFLGGPATLFVCAYNAKEDQSLEFGSWNEWPLLVAEPSA